MDARLPVPELRIVTCYFQLPDVRRLPDLGRQLGAQPLLLHVRALHGSDAGTLESHQRSGLQFKYEPHVLCPTIRFRFRIGHHLIGTLITTWVDGGGGRGATVD